MDNHDRVLRNSTLPGPASMLIWVMILNFQSKKCFRIIDVIACEWLAWFFQMGEKGQKIIRANSYWAARACWFHMHSVVGDPLVRAKRREHEGGAVLEALA